MSGEVGFVLAIPILDSEEHPSVRKARNGIAGIIYADSKSPGFFIDDDELRALVSMAQQYVDAFANAPVTAYNRIRNVPFTAQDLKEVVAEELPTDVKGVLEVVEGMVPPKASRPFRFNFDYSDLASTRA
jgi:hypothetical protein